MSRGILRKVVKKKKRPLRRYNVQIEFVRMKDQATMFRNSGETSNNIV